MFGPLSRDDRRALERFLWSHPKLRKYQILRLSGTALLIVAFGILLYFSLALDFGWIAFHSGFTPTSALLVYGSFGLAAVGTAVSIVGSVLRSKVLRAIALRPCPSCHQPSFFLSAYCRACGAPLPFCSDPLQPRPEQSP